MKNKKLIIASAFMLLSMMPAVEVITKQGGETIINTKSLTKAIRGYKYTTPVEIHIKGNKITKVEALPTKETPEYFDMAKAVLKKYNGKDIKKAQTLKVDAVTGATMSSEALIKNVQEGLKYYEEHK
ncbi:MAG: FMN-binding protein [Prevotella sp.]|nr:FMN-binding protein [Prevotella sp.]MBQ8453702.1 FMN-binding protein [Prevotella sp.]MBQ9534049.1 FMN-binding protein [Prevotella sp.]